MTDLTDATTVELITELRVRSRALVVGFDPLADKDGSFFLSRTGSKLVVAGLLRALTLDSDVAIRDDPRDRPPTDEQE